MEIDVLGDDGIAVRSALPLSPKHRLYVRSVLAGTQQTDGSWRLPLQALTRSELLGRLADQFDRDGIGYTLVGEAEREAAREVERRRSFARTLDRGRTFHESGAGLSAETINNSLAAVGWNFEARSLRPHQLASVSHALEVINAANFSVPGAGKTATALATFAAHLANETVDLAVVVGPLASFAPWELESALALPGVVRTKRVRGANSQARSFYYRSAEPRDILLVTYPTVVSDLHELTRLGERFRVMLIVDESHRIKRFRGGQWAPAMVRLANESRIRLILSGTPMPQGPVDLWSQLNVLWPKQEITGSRSSFKARADNNFGSVVDSVRPIFTRTPKSALGIQPYEVIFHSVDLPPLQSEVVDLIANRFRRDLSDADNWQAQLATLRRARPLRLLQAASNPDLLNFGDGFFGIPPLEDDGGTLMERLAEYRQREIPGKFLSALDIVRGQLESGHKTVVWTSFIKNIDQFAAMCRDQLGATVLTVDGRVPVDVEDSSEVSGDDPGEEMDVTREQRIRRFLTTDEPAILVANPAACGESISLHTACTTAIYLDRTYDCARYLQSVDRIHRLGLKPDDHVRVHILEAMADGAPTIDALVRLSLEAKQDRMQDLLEGGELRPAHIPSDAEAATGDRTDLAALLKFLLGE